jgi:D-beta-D-heptose 7-phosphate kinase/D-beta-D-heptose 1-phosphate adenosyltransferase
MKKILVIGDSCLDVYTYCKTSRLAPDKPVPVLEKIRTIATPGMAHNVFRNVHSLTTSCDLITNSNWKEVQKVRYVDEKSNHMFMRVDSAEKINMISHESLSFEYETIIVSDYDKGFLSEEQIEYICSNHSQVFLDTKKVLGDWAKNAKFIKINNYEYERSQKFIDGQINDKIIKTIGGDGCEYQGKLFPVKKKVEVMDVSGAGDTFMATLATIYTDTYDIESAINTANEYASEVVKHKGVTII